MQVTKTRRLVRQHIKKVGGSTIFNDRLVDGKRSVKVWGWGLRQYESFQRLLKAEGLVSEIVEFTRSGPAWNGGGRIQHRIHVWEEEVDPLDDFNYVGSRHHY